MAPVSNSTTVLIALYNSCTEYTQNIVNNVMNEELQTVVQNTHKIL